MLFRGCSSVRQHRDPHIVNGTIFEHVSDTMKEKYMNSLCSTREVNCNKWQRFCWEFEGKRLQWKTERNWYY